MCYSVALSSKSYKLGSFAGRTALATIGLNFALLLPAARILIAVRQGRGIRMLVLQIFCRPRVMRYEVFKGPRKDRVPTSRSLDLPLCALPCVCLARLDGRLGQIEYASSRHGAGSPPRSPFCHLCFVATRK